MSDAQRPRLRGAAAFLAATAVLVAACSGSATPAPSQAPASQAAGPGSGSAAPASGAPAASGTASGPRVTVDQGLLKYLPAAIGNFAVTYSEDATRDVVGDASLVKNADALAYGIAVDQATGDVVIAAVVQLKPGVMTDAFFRGWRASYDKAACDAAGGVVGNAEAQISNRTTYIGTCGGGAHTYHTYLDKANILVSAASVGTKRFGELLMGTLRP